MTEQIGCWPLSEPFPAVLRDRDLMRVLDLKHSRFYLRKAAREFDFLLVRPQLPNVTLYSGKLVEQWTRGELGESRYFQAARRRA